MNRSNPWRPRRHCPEASGSSRSRSLALIVTISMLAPGPALAIAPAEDPQPAQDTPVESLPADEPEGPTDAHFARIRELIIEGEARFKNQDYAGAIEPWQQAYELLTLCERVQLFVPLASAHWRAYQTDPNEEHLRQAKAMFDRGLESVGIMDERTRRDAQAQLVEVEAEIDRLEAERAQREREQAARDAVEQERLRLRRRQQQQDAAKREAEIERAHRRIRIAIGIGGGTIGLGGASLGAMTVALSLGAQIERRGADSMADAYEERQALLTRGEAYNRMAWATGAVGSALVLAGTTVLVVSMLRRRQLPRQTRARLAPSMHGMEVRF